MEKSIPQYATVTIMTSYLTQPHCTVVNDEMGHSREYCHIKMKNLKTPGSSHVQMSLTDWNMA
eukprot:9425351-Ditylum_brightwellii.AAC.1